MEVDGHKSYGIAFNSTGTNLENATEIWFPTICNIDESGPRLFATKYWIDEETFAHFPSITASGDLDPELDDTGPEDTEKSQSKFYEDATSLGFGRNFWAECGTVRLYSSVEKA